MNYIEFETSKNVYKLRLNTRNTVKLEKLLDGNPLKVFTEIKDDTPPRVETMAAILYTALLAYQDKTTLDKAYDIFDEWIESGHIVAEFIPIIIDLYRDAGLIQKQKN